MYTKGKWKFDENDYTITTEENDLFCIADVSPLNYDGRANAERICLCCNSHDELVAACEIAWIKSANHEKLTFDDCDVLKKALAKAKG